jgi:MFS transporter, MCT family, solute carrier family 16 (monocarboxylic acid transporters), member 10
MTLVLCTLLVAECHEYWHFLLCQGLGVGVSAVTFRLQELSAFNCNHLQVSCGVIFGPVFSIIAHWFKKKRSTALGIVSFVSSIGGAVFSVTFRNLNVTIG